MTVASAVGYLALLGEPSIQVQAKALHALESMVNYNWHEIADSKDVLEGMARSGQFQERQLAALICSKLHFHLGDLEKSVSFALMAGERFQLGSGDGDYVDIILTKAIDRYIAARQSSYPNIDRFTDDELSLLESLVERLVEKCLGLEEYVHCVGIGLECRRLDILEATLKAPPTEDQQIALIYYVVDMLSKFPPQFQNDLLRFTVSHLHKCSAPDFVTIADCLILLKDAKGLIELLQKLVISTDISIALQICFNINDNAQISVKEAVMSELMGAEILVDAISGESSNLLRLHYLSKSIASDLLILERTRTQFNQGNSMFHSAVSLSNGLIHSGTTNDDFIRKNMEWLGSASNWSKYTAISSLGSVYKGHRQQSRNMLSQYLPKVGVTTSEYSEGGACFALGLIHSGFPQDRFIVDQLLETLKGATSDVLQHGCCFGIGAAGLMSQREDAIEEVKAVLFTDNAISGEGAATALGLLKFGSGDQDLANQLLAYSRETKHDKIIRALDVSIGLIMFGQESLNLAQELMDCQEGWDRFCAVWIIALSYVGTGNKHALQHLLKLAVTDSDQSVRRVSVIAMAFVLIGHNTELPEMVRLLLESYNPNLRFGALLALGIGFAGTGDTKVLDMIDPLMRSDKIDYVRQAAMIAASMVIMEQSEKSQQPLRQHLERVIGTKHEEALAKFGAVLGQGILDAGGRNQCISLLNPNGSIDPIAVAGMALFCQYWFWYPNVNFLSLALRSTALIGVTASGKAPVMSVTCESKPSLYAYPEPIKGDKEATPVKLVTAILSTNVNTSTEQIDEKPKQVPSDISDQKPEPVEMEADSFSVPNFSRVTNAQAKSIKFDGRFRPVSRFHPRSISVLIDQEPDQQIEFIEMVDPIAVSSE